MWLDLTLLNYARTKLYYKMLTYKFKLDVEDGEDLYDEEDNNHFNQLSKFKDLDDE